MGFGVVTAVEAAGSGSVGGVVDEEIIVVTGTGVVVTGVEVTDIEVTGNVGETVVATCVVGFVTYPLVTINGFWSWLSRLTCWLIVFPTWP